MSRRILVWDLPTRLFHWSLAVSFVGAYLTAESERWRDAHVLLGYTVLGLLVFRLIWGFIGTRYARFADFVRGPRAVRDYVAGLAAGRPTHYTGHNPLGAVAIVLLMGLGLASSVSGWLLYDELGGVGLEDILEELHEVLSNGMLALVILHLLGVIYGSIAHRENLAWAMITGRKQGKVEQEIGSTRPWTALALAAGLVGGWVWGNLGSTPRMGSDSSYFETESDLETEDGEGAQEDESDDDD